MDQFRNSLIGGGWHPTFQPCLLAFSPPLPSPPSPSHYPFLGSGPDRGRRLVEWGGLAGWLAGPQIWLAWPQAWLAGPQAWLDGPEGGRMYQQKNGRKISPFYRTSSPIGAAAQKHTDARIYRALNTPLYINPSKIFW